MCRGTPSTAGEGVGGPIKLTETEKVAADSTVTAASALGQFGLTLGANPVPDAWAITSAAGLSPSVVKEVPIDCKNCPSGNDVERSQLVVVIYCVVVALLLTGGMVVFTPVIVQFALA